MTPAMPNRPSRAPRLAAPGPALLPAVLALAALLPPGMAGQEPVVRTFTDEHGLAPAPVWALAQDDAGFLWVGTVGGLFRFDGDEFRRWAPDMVPGIVRNVTVGPAGAVAVSVATGELVVIRGGATEPVPLPGGVAFQGGTTLSFDEAGTLWAIDGSGTVVFRPPGGRWSRVPPATFDGEFTRFVETRRGGGVHVGTDRALWHLDGDGSVRGRLPIARAIATAESEAGELLVLAGAVEAPGWRVVRASGGEAREVPLPDTVPHGRAIAIAKRWGTTWVALDRFLVALRPDASLAVVGLEAGVESGGPLLVDREGSLWLGSFVGLHQLPEPETRVWSERQGLPSRHVRYLARTGEVLRVMTWSGPVMLRREGETWTAVDVAWDSRSHLCTDRDGVVWTGSDDDVRALQGAGDVPWPGPPPGRVHGCTADPSGGVWIGAVGNLRHIEAETGRVRMIPPPSGTAAADPLVAALHDRANRLWLVAPDRICQASAPRLLGASAGVALPEGLWSCEVVPGVHAPAAMVEFPDGGLWVSSDRLGVLSRGPEGWRPLPMEGAPTRTVFSLVPSPRSGVWVLGHGIVDRVRPAEEGGWEVLERLTRWQGLPSTSAGHLVEDEDGTIWIATAQGVIEVPPEARFQQPQPLPVAVVEARVDEEPVPVDETLELPHSRNRVELRFAALSFRERSRLRHQVRLSPDGAWSGSRGAPVFRWVDLPPGSYEVEYRAALDGEEWSTLPLPFAVRVHPPWYRSSWFFGAVIGLLGVVVWAAYRARVAYLLGLERQRTRIAMDLHDEVGSGLASVGILSGMLAGEVLDPGERIGAAREIARVADRLGHSLSDIVWSLDPGVPAMKDLAVRLAEHGGRLFADASVDFVTRFPERWPARTLPLEVRRNVLLIGLEALHNAARHARAERVELELLPTRAGRWRLTVRDDGVGAPSPEGPDRGHRRAVGGRGIGGMRLRAEAIRATLTVVRPESGGTEVTLSFRHGTARGGPGSGRTTDLRGRLARGTRRIVRRARGPA